MFHHVSRRRFPGRMGLPPGFYAPAKKEEQKQPTKDALLRWRQIKHISAKINLCGHYVDKLFWDHNHLFDHFSF